MHSCEHGDVDASHVLRCVAVTPYDPHSVYLSKVLLCLPDDITKGKTHRHNRNSDGGDGQPTCEEEQPQVRASSPRSASVVIHGMAIRVTAGNADTGCDGTSSLFEPQPPLRCGASGDTAVEQAEAVVTVTAEADELVYRMPLPRSWTRAGARGGCRIVSPKKTRGRVSKSMSFSPPRATLCSSTVSQAGVVRRSRYDASGDTTTTTTTHAAAKTIQKAMEMHMQEVDTATEHKGGAVAEEAPVEAARTHFTSVGSRTTSMSGVEEDASKCPSANPEVEPRMCVALVDHQHMLLSFASVECISRDSANGGSHSWEESESYCKHHNEDGGRRGLLPPLAIEQRMSSQGSARPPRCGIALVALSQPTSTHAAGDVGEAADGNDNDSKDHKDSDLSQSASTATKTAAYPYVATRLPFLSFTCAVRDYTEGCVRYNARVMREFWECKMRQHSRSVNCSSHRSEEEEEEEKENSGGGGGGDSRTVGDGTLPMRDDRNATCESSLASSAVMAASSSSSPLPCAVARNEPQENVVVDAENHSVIKKEAGSCDRGSSSSSSSSGADRNVVDEPLAAPSPRAPLVRPFAAEVGDVSAPLSRQPPCDELDIAHEKGREVSTEAVIPVADSVPASKEGAIVEVVSSSTSASSSASRCASTSDSEGEPMPSVPEAKETLHHHHQDDPADAVQKQQQQPERPSPTLSMSSPQQEDMVVKQHSHHSSRQEEQHGQDQHEEAHEQATEKALQWEEEQEIEWRFDARLCHRFIVTDTVGHALWALHVRTTPQPSIRVVSRANFLVNTINEEEEEDDERSDEGVAAQNPREQQQQSGEGEVFESGEDENTTACTASRSRGRSSRSTSATAAAAQSLPSPLLGGTKGFVDGHFSVARFCYPTALCWRFDDDDDGEEYGREEEPAAGRAHSFGRRSTTTTTSSNNAGTATKALGSRCCEVLFISDTGNHAIRYANFHNLIVRTVAGVDGVPGYRDGSCVSSALWAATAMAWCASGLVFGDGPNGVLRLITGIGKRRPRHRRRSNDVTTEKKGLDGAENTSSAGEGRRAEDKAPPADGTTTRNKGENGKDGAEEIEKEGEEMPTASTGRPRVWTLAGSPGAVLGNHEEDLMGYVDAQNPQRARIGCISDIAILSDTSSGSGDTGAQVFFTDRTHHAIRVLDAHGVRTVVGPLDYVTLHTEQRKGNDQVEKEEEEMPLLPAGLVHPSQLLACAFIKERAPLTMSSPLRHDPSRRDATSSFVEGGVCGVCVNSAPVPSTCVSSLKSAPLPSLKETLEERNGKGAVSPRQSTMSRASLAGTAAPQPYLLSSTLVFLTVSPITGAVSMILPVAENFMERLGQETHERLAARRSVTEGESCSALYESNADEAYEKQLVASLQVEQKHMLRLGLGREGRRVLGEAGLPSVTSLVLPLDAVPVAGDVKLRRGALVQHSSACAGASTSEEEAENETSNAATAVESRQERAKRKSTSAVATEATQAHIEEEDEEEREGSDAQDRMLYDTSLQYVRLRFPWVLPPLLPGPAACATTTRQMYCYVSGRVLRYRSGRSGSSERGQRTVHLGRNTGKHPHISRSSVNDSTILSTASAGGDAFLQQQQQVGTGWQTPAVSSAEVSIIEREEDDVEVGGDDDYSSADACAALEAAATAAAAAAEVAMARFIELSVPPLRQGKKVMPVPLAPPELSAMSSTSSFSDQHQQQQQQHPCEGADTHFYPPTRSGPSLSYTQQYDEQSSTRQHERFAASLTAPTGAREAKQQSREGVTATAAAAEKKISDKGPRSRSPRAGGSTALTPRSLSTHRLMRRGSSNNNNNNNNKARRGPSPSAAEGAVASQSSSSSQLQLDEHHAPVPTLDGIHDMHKGSAALALASAHSQQLKEPSLSNEKSLNEVKGSTQSDYDAAVNRLFAVYRFFATRETRRCTVAIANAEGQTFTARTGKEAAQDAVKASRKSTGAAGYVASNAAHQQHQHHQRLQRQVQVISRVSTAELMVRDGRMSNVASRKQRQTPQPQPQPQQQELHRQELLHPSQDGKEAVVVDEMTSYTMSMLAFWRFLYHTEYVAVPAALASAALTNEGETEREKRLEQGAGGSAAASSTTTTMMRMLLARGEDGKALLPLRVTDWRALVYILHACGCTVCGYHTVSHMSFSSFRRVVLLVSLWASEAGKREAALEQKSTASQCARNDSSNAGEEEERAKVRQQQEEEEEWRALAYGWIDRLPLIEALGEGQVIAAYTRACERAELTVPRLREYITSHFAQGCERRASETARVRSPPSPLAQLSPIAKSGGGGGGGSDTLRRISSTTFSPSAGAAPTVAAHEPITPDVSMHVSEDGTRRGSQRNGSSVTAAGSAGSDIHAPVCSSSQGECVGDAEVDELMRLLITNEAQLRQLFNAYSRPTRVHRSSRYQAPLSAAAAAAAAGSPSSSLIIDNKEEGEERGGRRNAAGAQAAEVAASTCLPHRGRRKVRESSATPSAATVASAPAPQDIFWKIRHVYAGSAAESEAVRRTTSELLPTLSFRNFQALFTAVDVYPTLLSQALLSRAFVDALTTPLTAPHLSAAGEALSFLGPTTPLAAAAVVTKERDGEEERGGSYSNGEAKQPGGKAAPADAKVKGKRTAVRHVGTSAAGKGSGQQQQQLCLKEHGQLLFLTFVEAFVRVALTAFSLFAEVDSVAFPTATAKVRGLMAWINKQVTLQDRRRSGAGTGIGALAGAVERGVASQTGAPPPVFPARLKLFKLAPGKSR